MTTATFTAVGYILTLCAAIANGSFLVPFKKKSVQDLHLNDIVFAFYFSVGVFTSSLLVMALTPVNSICVSGASDSVAFVPLGFVGGLILVVSIACNFIATGILGISTNAGIYSGVAIVTSVVWGLAVFDEPVVNYGLTVVGLLFIIFGITSIANVQKITAELNDRKCPLVGGLFRFSSTGQILNKEHKTSSSDEVPASTEARVDVTTQEFFVGVLFSVAIGVSGGTIFVPLHFVPLSQSGFVFVPAFGVGALVGCSGLIAAIYVKDGSLPAFHWREAGLYGILSGIIWNINSVCSIVAIPILGYALAFPLTQLSVLVAGTWGIGLFGELSGKAAAVFYICACIVLVGAAMLAFGLQ